MIELFGNVSWEGIILYSDSNATAVDSSLLTESGKSLYYVNQLDTVSCINWATVLCIYWATPFSVYTPSVGFLGKLFHIGSKNSKGIGCYSIEVKSTCTGRCCKHCWQN